MKQAHEEFPAVTPSGAAYSNRPLERGVRAILVVDMVESVRLIEKDEVGVLERWLSLVGHVEARVLPELGGELVKSLGDGMLLDFPDARSATSAAFAIQLQSRCRNVGLAADRQMLLRMGIAVGAVLVDRRDI